MQSPSVLSEIRMRKSAEYSNLSERHGELTALKARTWKAIRVNCKTNKDEKSDIWTSMTILGMNAGIECKNQATLHIPEWWKQTKKLESLNREPVLAFKIAGEPLEATKVVIYLDTLLELIKNQKLPTP